MKPFSLLFLAAAPLAASFVLPDEQQVLSVFSDGEKTATHNKHHQYEYGQLNELVGPLALPDMPRLAGRIAEGLQEFAAHDHGPDGMRAKGKKCRHAKGRKEKKHKEDKKDKKNSAKHHQHQAEDVFDIRPLHKPGFFDKVKGHFMHLFGWSCHGKPRHDSHRVHNQTIYQLISKSNHTRIITQFINQYDEVVQYLNSTNANCTVFVPVDEAFKHFHHKPENISNATVLNWLKYHASPEVFTIRDFFDVQTVPTLLEDEFPHRISTLVGFKGLLLNFHSRVIRPDIFASNGVIHGINEFLIPPLAAVDTIDLVPSVFSTLNLALIKTGLIDKISAHKGTIFAPSNHAFERLGPKINAFLFSRAGKKYLKALLKYHVVPNHRVFSDAYYHSSPGAGNETLIDNAQHLDLPTLFHGKPVAIDIYHLHRLTHFVINKKSHVSIANVPVQEGVLHVVKSVLVPPRRAELEYEQEHIDQKHEPELEQEHEFKHEHEHDEFRHKREYKGKHEHCHEHDRMSIRELMERLEEFVE